MVTTQYSKLVDSVIKNNANITSAADVAKFMSDMYMHLNLNFHPDDPFEQYVDENGDRLFDDRQSAELNKIVDKCFEVAGDNVYEIGLKYINDIVFGGELSESLSELILDIKDDDKKSDPLYLDDSVLKIKDSTGEEGRLPDLQKLPVQLIEKFSSKKQANFFRYMASKGGKLGKKWKGWAKEWSEDTDFSKLPDSVSENFLTKAVKTSVTWLKNTLNGMTQEWKTVCPGVEYSMENGKTMLRLGDDVQELGSVEGFSAALDRAPADNDTVAGVLYKEVDGEKYGFKAYFDVVDGKVFVSKVDYSNMFNVGATYEGKKINALIDNRSPAKLSKLSKELQERIKEYNQNPTKSNLIKLNDAEVALGLPRTCGVTERKRMFMPGDRVRIADLSGVDSNKVVTIANMSDIKTDGMGVPTNVDGAYKPVDWFNEYPIRYEDGSFGLMFKNRLSKVQESVTNVQDDAIEVSFKKSIKDIFGESIPVGLPLTVTHRGGARVELGNMYWIDKKAYDGYLAKGVLVKTNVKGKTFNDLPDNIQDLVNAGKVTYRGTGMEEDSPLGTFIKVNGQEYLISDEQFEELGGIKKIRFSAPYRTNESASGNK
mgnify:FL=1